MRVSLLVPPQDPLYHLLLLSVLFAQPHPNVSELYYPVDVVEHDLVRADCHVEYLLFFWSYDVALESVFHLFELHIRPDLRHVLERLDRYPRVSQWRGGVLLCLHVSVLRLLLQRASGFDVLLFYELFESVELTGQLRKLLNVQHICALLVFPNLLHLCGTQNLLVCFIGLGSKAFVVYFRGCLTPECFLFFYWVFWDKFLLRWGVLLLLWRGVDVYAFALFMFLYSLILLIYVCSLYLFLVSDHEGVLPRQLWVTLLILVLAVFWIVLYCLVLLDYV